ncbi:hypothetical protein VE03_02491 [Pseudogymnoascus sp. 23342-1-I1]|nr:hypothetical protein VE03_02491 [Pseudogymnoascus sp. 23342-1-I1]
MSAPTDFPHPLLDQLNKDGFVVIPSLLSPQALASLRTATTEVDALARTGKWPYIRTLPKQFPPWSLADLDKGIWGVQHLMHPKIPNSASFASSYFSPRTLEVVSELLQCSTDDLVMELYNLLVRPDHPFALRWHRDDIAPTATAEEETERLAKPAWHAQWNLALYDDASLIVVPGTHARPRTDAERNAYEYEDNMPGQLVVQLKAGDAVFYNNNILHRGVYDAGKARATLHGSMGHVKGGRDRARNVLQHGCGEWVDQVDFGAMEGRDREVAEGMRKRLVELGRVSGDIGYSQVD